MGEGPLQWLIIVGLDGSFLIGIGLLILAAAKRPPLFLMLGSLFILPFVFLYLSGNPGYGWTRLIPVILFIAGLTLHFREHRRSEAAPSNE